MGKLTNQVAVVTGASKGIGAAIAKALAAEGAAVVVNYASSKEGADRVVADITGKHGKAIAVHADLEPRVGPARPVRVVLRGGERVDADRAIGRPGHRAVQQRRAQLVPAAAARHDDDRSPHRPAARRNSGRDGHDG